MASDVESKIARRRIVHSYVSSVVSISLVLLLVGAATLLLMNTRKISDYFRENMKMAVILVPEATDSDAMALQSSIDELTFVKGTEFISREQGEKEMAALLGEDFLNVFKASPVPLSVEISLQPAYVQPDSLEKAGAIVSALPMVEEVSYQATLVEALDSNLKKITAVFAVFIVLMLFISFVLINNTIRLTVHARRFTIHTMRLVGATRAFIRRPFMARAAILGLCAAAVAIVLLSGVIFLVKASFPIFFQAIGTDILLYAMGSVVAVGLAICMLSTYFVVNKLVAFDKDQLYY